MKFKIDENLPLAVAELLRDSGHDAHTIRDEGLTGSPDEIVSGISEAEGRILLTLDKDFANLQQYPPERHAGIIVLRAAVPSKPVVLELVAQLLGYLASEPIGGALWIVEKGRLRIRRSRPVNGLEQ